MADMVHTSAAWPVPSSVVDLVQNYSIEATAEQVLSIAYLHRTLPAGTRVYICSRGEGDTWAAARACEHIAGARLKPVPVMRPRSIANADALATILGRCSDAGAEALLLAETGGETGGEAAAGPFHSSRDVLETGLLERCGFHQVGFAAYPNGHPDLTDAALFDAVKAQADYARDSGTYVWLTTQHVFSAKPVVSWLDELSRRGINLPVRVGVPGPSAGDFPRTVASRPDVALAADAAGRGAVSDGQPVCRWTPDRLLSDLASYRYGRAHSRLIGIHVSPFGALTSAARWLRSFDERIENWAV